MQACGVDLVYRPDLPAIIARWQRAVTPAELQTGYELLLQVADDARCGRWLLDLRRREDLTEPTVNAWFSREFAPALRGRYAEAVRLAFLISPLRAQQTVTAIVSATNTDCHIATFTDEAVAYNWLAEG
jgi:hypothetical protein